MSSVGHHSDGLLDDRARGEGNLHSVLHSGFDAREIKDIPDDGEQRLRRTAHGFGEFLLQIGESGVEQQFGHADDTVHGSPDFVAHGGHELRLGE